MKLATVILSALGLLLVAQRPVSADLYVGRLSNSSLLGHCGQKIARFDRFYDFDSNLTQLSASMHYLFALLKNGYFNHYHEGFRYNMAMN